FRRGGTAVDWSSPADEGWRRAAAALRTAEDAAMSRRTAGRSTAPGTRPATAPPPGTPAQPPPRHSVRPPTGQPAPGTRPAPAPWTSGGTPGPAAAQAEGSGLPVRRRGATLVPGSIPGAEEAGRSGGPVRRPADAGNVAST